MRCSKQAEPPKTSSKPHQYLNSGPGGIGGLFVHEKHHGTNMTKLQGWWSHKLETRFLMNNGEWSRKWEVGRLLCSVQWCVGGYLLVNINFLFLFLYFIKKLECFECVFQFFIDILFLFTPFAEGVCTE